MQKAVLALVVIGAAAAALWYWYPTQREAGARTYESSAYGFSLSYPATYFEYGTDHEGGERLQYTLALIEDTPHNRALVAGEIPGTEGPPTITIGVFQNNLDSYTAESFVRGTNFSNFKLSDGVLTPTTVGGEPALRYHASGLYESENVVVARPDFVYMFTVTYLTPADRIIRDFEAMLETVRFTKATNLPTSADNAPPGSIHNLPVPPAVAAVRAHAAEKFGVDEGVVIIMSAYERQWPDSCLGTAGPDEMCAQVVTPGYEVRVQAAGQEALFRTNSDGSAIRRVQ